jgi:hypothetical protein
MVAHVADFDASSGIGFELGEGFIDDNSHKYSLYGQRGHWPVFFWNNPVF